MRLTVPFAILAPQYWCVNPSHQKTEKLGVLHRFGKFWFQNYKKSSLAEMLAILFNEDTFNHDINVTSVCSMIPGTPSSRT